MNVPQLDRWIGRNQLSPGEIDSNRFLKVASLLQTRLFNVGGIGTVAKICRSLPTAYISTISRHPDL